MKQLLVVFLVNILVFSPLSAINDIDTSERKRELNRVEGDKGQGGLNATTTVVPVLQQNVEKIKDTNFGDQNFAEFTKVSLMDLVLESVSNSDTLKSNKEKVNIAQYKLNASLADYYPTLDFEYKLNKYRASDLTDGGYKFYDERNYKFVLKQNLYSGGETQSNISNMKKQLDVAKNKYYIALEEVVGKAIKAYFGVVFSHRAVLVNERNMDKLNKILSIVQTKYDNGALSIGDLTAIEANVSNAQTKLVKVKSKLAESLKYYEYIAGEDFAKTLPYEKNFNIDIGTYDLLFERALEKNRNLITYHENIEASKYKLKKNEAQFAPSLDFQLSYDVTRDKENFSEPEDTLKGALSLTYNIFNGGSDKNKSLELYSTIRDLQYRLKEEERKLKWNIAKLHNAIVSTKESISSKISEVISSRKMVDAYWEGFKLGEQDLQVLLQGQKQLNSAETDLVDHEQTNVTNFFTLLNYTGDLLSFFDIDPEHPKFIDFSKSSYKSELYIDDKFLEEEERLKREAKIKAENDRVNELASKATKDENIKAFAKEFMNANDEYYTIDTGVFDNIFEAEKFIKTNNFDKLSFPYDIVNKYELDTKTAYGIFENEQKANEELNVLNSKKLNKEMKVVKISQIKRLYSDYLSGLEVIVEPTPPEVKVIEKIKTIEKIKQEKKKKEFALSEEFKTKFLNSPSNYFTINVSSFKDMKDVETLLNENKAMYDKSFAFNYVNFTKLVRLMHGIYPTYEEAQSDLDTLGDINKDYHPVIEKISKSQLMYKDNESLNIKKPEPKKVYEYVDITTKTEYKEPVILKDSKDVKDKVLKEKVDKLLNKPEETKENKEADKKEEKAVEKKEVIEAKQSNTSANLSVSAPTVIPVVVPVVVPVVTSNDKNKDEVSQAQVVTSLSDVDMYNDKEFKNKFLNAPKSSYSINVATLDKVERVGKFLEYYELEDKAFVFTVGKNLDRIKVMYGVYDNRDDALKAVSLLPQRLKDLNSPYIEKIFRKQNAYIQYHGKTKKKEVEISDEIKEETPTSKDELKVNEEKTIKVNDDKIDSNVENSNKTELKIENSIPVIIPAVAPIIVETQDKKEQEISDDVQVDKEIKSTEKQVEDKEEPKVEVKKEDVVEEIIEEEETLENKKTETSLENEPKVNNIEESLLIEPTKEQIQASINETIVDKKDDELLNKAEKIQDEELIIEEKPEVQMPKFRVYISNVSKNRVNWFIDRYGIDSSKLIKIDTNNEVALYLGDFDSEDEAKKVEESLHPRLTNKKIVELGVN